MSEYVAESARLRVENETLRAECALLRDEADRLSSVNRSLQARLAIADAELTRLRRYTSAIEHSRPWRAVQTLRALVGRRW